MAATAGAKTSRLSTRRSPGLDWTVCAGQTASEVHLSLRPLPGETPAGLVGRLAEALQAHSAVVARQEICGSLEARSEVLEALRRLPGGLSWPVTYVEGASCGAEPLARPAAGLLAGTHLLAVAGAPVQTVKLQGRVVGRTYSDRWARYLFLGDVGPRALSVDKPTQARQTFEQLEAALGAAGMSFAHVVRTWLFLDDILSWYGPLNAVRTGFFRQRGVFKGLVPASTGVGGRNAAGAALTAGAWAAEPVDNAFSVREISSPKQCGATEYGSSFSRAVELSTPEWRRLLISGTASIAPDGRSLCAGDLEGQIELTMEVVRAILVSRGMDFSDAARVTAYLKRPEFAPAFDRWRARFGLAEWPVVYAVADICRPELLFEVELDAVAPASRPV